MQVNLESVYNVTYTLLIPLHRNTCVWVFSKKDIKPVHTSKAKKVSVEGY